MILDSKLNFEEDLKTISTKIDMTIGLSIDYRKPCQDNHGLQFINLSIGNILTTVTLYSTKVSIKNRKIPNTTHHLLWHGSFLVIPKNRNHYKVHAGTENNLVCAKVLLTSLLVIYSIWFLWSITSSSTLSSKNIPLSSVNHIFFLNIFSPSVIRELNRLGTNLPNSDSINTFQ